jgi:hypothetical protein
MVYIVGLLTTGSAVVYLVDWARHMAAGERPESPGGGSNP